MSGVIPQVAALMGPCAAGTAYIPGLADFVPMVKGRGSMALAGPYLTKAVTGEDVTQEELGGSRVHTRISGVGDLEVDSDEECIAGDQGLPLASSRRTARRRRRSCPTSDPADRRDEELLDILPDSPRKPYDMYEVIGRIVDDGRWFDLKPRWARTIITCLARDGRPAGRHRRQPAEAPRRHPRERLRRQGGALHQPLRRVRHPAAVPAGRAGLHGRARRSSTRGSSGTARRCSTRSRAPRCRRSRW